jgi:glutaredoxin
MRNNMFIIYGTPSCGYCIQAKKLLTAKEHDFSYVDLSDTTPGEQAKLMEIAGKPFRTVPQIFRNSFGSDPTALEYVGGYTELQALLNEDS